MKTKEELNALKEEVETLNKKLHELTEEELAQVSGGSGSSTGAGNFGVGDWVIKLRTTAGSNTFFSYRVTAINGQNFDADVYNSHTHNFMKKDTFALSQFIIAEAPSWYHE